MDKCLHCINGETPSLSPYFRQVIVSCSTNRMYMLTHTKVSIVDIPKIMDGRRLYLMLFPDRNGNVRS